MDHVRPFGKAGLPAAFWRLGPFRDSKTRDGHPVCGMPRPWISTNLAISLDGKISSAAFHPSGWTSREDHARLHELRRPADALLVGRGTLVADRMALTVPGKAVQPLRCVVSTTGAPSFTTGRAGSSMARLKASEVAVDAGTSHETSCQPVGSGTS
jgi:hypothetical protein